MSPAIPPLQFSGKHVIPFAIRADDGKDELRIGPKPPEIGNFWKLMGVLFALLSMALVFSLVMALNSDGPTDRAAKAIPLLIVLFGVPTAYCFVGLLWYGACTEFEKGPVLIFHRGRRVVALPRHETEVRLDDLLAVGLLEGWHVERSNYASWVAELSLIVAQGDQPPRVVAFLMDGQTKEIKAMAEQVASALGRPLRRERFKP